MKHKFVLTYEIQDSGTSTITSKDKKIILFNTVDKAIKFREKNDLSKIDEEEHLFWLNCYNHSTRKEVGLQHCCIELYDSRKHYNKF